VPLIATSAMKKLLVSSSKLLAMNQKTMCSD
jgi:hypothetical protein